jgi:hypothetical protein
MPTYRTELTAPSGDPGIEPWDLDFRLGRDLTHSVKLTADEMDELELTLARNRAQLRRPRLLWLIPDVCGHRFDECGDAIDFRGQARQYDDDGPAVIICPNGWRFPLDEKVEVLTP